MSITKSYGKGQFSGSIHRVGRAETSSYSIALIKILNIHIRNRSQSILLSHRGIDVKKMLKPFQYEPVQFIHGLITMKVKAF